MINANNDIPLTFAALPDLAQLKPLFTFAPRLWARPEVLALWVGGSIARGNADRYSDVDLRVAVRDGAFERWQRGDVQTLLGEVIAAHTRMEFGDRAFLHHVVLTTGDIYDIWVQCESHAVGADAILILGCRDENLRVQLDACKPNPPAVDAPASPDIVRQCLVDYWINTHKHRKVLDRNLRLLAMTGIQTERALLLRLWHIEITGLDTGDARTQTIHGLTRRMQTIEQAKGTKALQILGASLADRDDIQTAIEMLHDEVAQTGRLLAARLNFDYPALAEDVARQGWREFRGQAETK